MGYIKEPKGVDFAIKSEPLDDKSRKEISEFIKAYKADHGNKKTLGKAGKASRPVRIQNTSVKKKD